ncbi:MAG: hypothetical protein KatS3mg131_1142 [Candidatus Tectimicrobiota bacterium]|nr:MAG: hypothetical protein KatS3mg131_1142 [Candidatus Tectomicrobia bacterium]
MKRLLALMLALGLVLGVAGAALAFGDCGHATLTSTVKATPEAEKTKAPANPTEEAGTLVLAQQDKPATPAPAPKN